MRDYQNEKQAVTRRRNKQRAAELMRQGLTCRETADQLGLANQTVERYRSKLVSEGVLPRYRRPS